MPSSKLSAARNIAKALRPSEDMIDTAILRNAQLVASIVEARLQTGVAAEVGHDAFMSASAAMAALREARDQMVRCHEQLAATRDGHDLSPQAVGCTLKGCTLSKLNGRDASDNAAVMPHVRVA